MRLLPILVRREFTEGIRQRALVGTLAGVLGIIALFGFGLLFTFEWFWDTPGFQRQFDHWMTVLEMPVTSASTVAGAVVITLQLLIFNQLMSMTAVMAGHAGIHDKLSGTLPFLMLAPVGRFELLTGKVIGALSVPFVIYLAVGGSASLLMASLSAASDTAGAYLPPSAGWFVSFTLAAPAWSLATGTVCVLLSSVARDVRAAQQASWAVVFFATFVLSPILVLAVPEGPVVQLGLALVGLTISGGLLAVGSWRIGRRLSR